MGSSESLQWHYAVDGEKFGPVTSAELRRQVMNKRLKPTDLVWKTGFPEWVPASKIKGLFDPPSRALPVKSTRPLTQRPVKDSDDEIRATSSRSPKSKTIVRTWDSDDNGDEDDYGDEIVERPRKRRKKKRSSSFREPENYAGFWIRVIPFIIDYVLSGLIYLAIAFVLLYITNAVDPEFKFGNWIHHTILWCTSVFCILLYFVFMEASPLQASPGKLMLGLRIGNEEEEPASVPALMIREFSKFLPGMLYSTFFMDDKFFISYMREEFNIYHLLWVALFIPYVIAAFTPRKQALYDLVAGTYVYSCWE